MSQRGPGRPRKDGRKHRLATSKKDVDVKGYSHPNKKRKNLPTDQTSKFMKAEDKKPRDYKPERRSTTGPVLSWMREMGLEDETTQSTPLYIHEKVHPMAFIESLRENMPRQEKLFESYDGIDDNKNDYDFYRHKANWQNRIIRGESRHVMTSLLDRENMSGKVQMIYFDPPYGENFSAIMQLNTRDRSANNKNKKGIPPDNIGIKAFRDTYKNGVHSYFDNIYRIATYARDLLADSGSFFLQISSDNLNNIGVILDEVFGSENRVSLITFAKTGGGSSNTLPGAADYLLWYAKDRSNMKYYQLYEEKKNKKEMIEFMSSYAMLELDNKTSRSLSGKEKTNPGLIPENARLCRRNKITSQNVSKTRSESYHWKSRNKTYPCPPNSQWRVGYDGLDKLDELNRLAALENGQLGWKLYEDEILGKRINNIWAKTMSSKDLHYVVETANSVIERCIFMTTDSGDLVYDPTCGSGTTAYVAEKWGRRWIVSDMSLASTTFTRQLLTTAIFPYYHLIDSDEGLKIENELRQLAKQTPIKKSKNESFENDPSKGLVTKRMPELTAAVLAYNKEPKVILFVDRPKTNDKLLRVSAPFTVETLSPYKYEKPESLLDHAKKDKTYKNVQKTVIDALEQPGIRIEIKHTAGNKLYEQIPITNITDYPNGKCITHQGKFNGKDCAILIAPPDCMVPLEMISRAADQAALTDRFEILVVVAFNYEGAAYSEKVEEKGKLLIHKVMASMDLQIHNLENKLGDNTLMLIGEPQFKIEVDKKNHDKISVEILGLDTYNPKTNTLDQGQPSDVICWMLDTNYDGKSFFVRLIHFPGANTDLQIKKFHKKLINIINPDRWEHTLSTKSAFFTKPESGQIAIRIITETQLEMTSILTVK